jgi:hypothetical protein
MDNKLENLYQKIDIHLYQAQLKYEEYIKLYGEFREAYINAKVEYEKRLSEEIEKSYKKGDKVTVVKEMAKNRCIEEYHQMLKNETFYKKYKALMVGLESRINTIKALMRMKLGEIIK